MFSELKNLYFFSFPQLKIYILRGYLLITKINPNFFNGGGKLTNDMQFQEVIEFC